MQPLWEALSNAGASLVLTAHDHHYERFAPMNARGEAVPTGMRSFVVGTGGAALYRVEGRRAHSEAVRVGQWGLLKLKLEPAGYEWTFLPAERGGPSDGGRAMCAERK
jgi:hypothetical protein